MSALVALTNISAQNIKRNFVPPSSNQNLNFFSVSNSTLGFWNSKMAETNSVSSCPSVHFLVDIVLCDKPVFHEQLDLGLPVRSNSRPLDRICEKLAIEIVHVRKNVCQNF